MITTEEKRAILETANWWTNGWEWGQVGTGL